MARSTRPPARSSIPIASGRSTTGVEEALINSLADLEQLSSSPHVRAGIHAGAAEAFRVLLVEDNPADAFLVKRHLERSSLHNADVVVETRVEDAIAQVRGGTFSVVLLDLTLPDAHGLEGISMLRHVLGCPPIVILTGMDDEQMALNALKHGAQDYLVKGEFEQPLLCRVVQYAVHRNRIESRLSYLARHDLLTGLSNRVAFQERLEAVLSRNRRQGTQFALFFLDLDNFKVVNDTFGHDAGDDLLRKVGVALRNAVRDYETVARLGGDEFGVIVEHVDGVEDAATIAHRIEDGVLKVTESWNDMLRVGISVGIVMYPENGLDGEELLKCADSAMYLAKENGGGCQFFSQEMHSREQRLVLLEQKLREALRDGKFYMHYQPQVDARSGELLGAEALLRVHWDGPDKPGPAEFIPVLERARLIDDVGLWVLRDVCGQVARWKDRLPERFRVAVNLSARQFRHPMLTTWISSTLAQTGLDPSYLELELTESMLVEDTKATEATLRELKDRLGVRLAIDDFGTGYSSLAYLMHFPFDVLKVDRLFVKDLGPSNDNLITSGIVTLGHSLGLSVVAEGVETDCQEDILRDYGCDVLQGYHCGRPMSAEAFEERFVRTEK